MQNGIVGHMEIAESLVSRPEPGQAVGADLRPRAIGLVTCPCFFPDDV